MGRLKKLLCLFRSTGTKGHEPASLANQEAQESQQEAQENRREEHENRPSELYREPAEHPSQLRQSSSEIFNQDDETQDCPQVDEPKSVADEGPTRNSSRDTLARVLEQDSGSPDKRRRQAEQERASSGEPERPFARVSSLDIARCSPEREPGQLEAPIYAVINKSAKRAPGLARSSSGRGHSSLPQPPTKSLPIGFSPSSTPHYERLEPVSSDDHTYSSLEGSRSSCLYEEIPESTNSSVKEKAK